MSTIIISMPMKRYLEKLFVAKTRRERWKAKKHYRMERREQQPYQSLALSEFITLNSVDSNPLTIEEFDDIMNTFEWS